MRQAEHQFTVRLHDVDAAGILFFAHLFRHAHDAYECFMDARGLALHRLLEAGAHLMPLVHAEADYLRPLRQGDRVRVLVETARLGGTSFTVAYTFLGPQGTEVARARTVHALVDRQSFQPVPLPESLRTALGSPAPGR